MYVKIGNYKNWWIGPYQIADLLKHVGYSEDECFDIGSKFPEWVSDVCNWVYERNPLRLRSVKVRIDDYDVFDMDDTLVKIIHPMLAKFIELKQSGFFVEDSDVPEELMSMNASRQENSWDVDENYFKRCNWVLDEMLWAFTELYEDTWEEQYFNYTKHDIEGYQAHNARINNGTRLFGLYLRNLWS